MCQMCEEYEAELRRLGLAEEARKVREERHGPRQREPRPSKVEPPPDGDARL